MKYILLDIETTGIKADYHEITEISILNCETLEQVTWDVKIKYPQKVSQEALMTTHQNVATLLNKGRYIEEVIPEIDEFIKAISNDPDEIVCIGHNVSFDRRFLEYNWKSNNKKFPANYWLCTMEMSKKFVKNILNIHEKTSFALANMLKIASIPENPGAHSAMIDVQNEYKLYSYMIKRGLSNSEFIKMSPTLLEGIGKVPIKKTSTRKKKNLEKDSIEVKNIMDSMDFEPTEDLSSNFESDNDD